MEKLTEDLVIYELLGKGGMAEVYRGIYSGAGGFEKRVAVKRVLPSFAQDPDRIEMFLAEANLSAKFSDKNIAHVFQSGKANRVPFLVMEYIDGITLKQLLKRAAEHDIPVSPSVVTSIGIQVSSALSYAHAFNDPITGEKICVIHRDLSPDNIMVDARGNVKVLDFGIAKALQAGKDFTQTIVMGKLSYLSPEMVLGQPIDERTDLWALGAVLFELLTGRRPFEGNNFEIIERIKSAPIPSLTKQRRDIPPALSRIVLKLLERDLALRYQSAQDLLNDLTRFNEGHPDSHSKLTSVVRAYFDTIPAPENPSNHTLTDFPSIALNPSQVEEKSVMRHRVQLPKSAGKKPFLLIIFCLTLAAFVGAVAISRHHFRSVGPQLIWAHGDRRIDISPPELEYKEVGSESSTNLSGSGCMAACLEISKFSGILFSPDLATTLSKFPPASSEPGGFALLLLKQAKDNENALNRLRSRCNEYPAYCKTAWHQYDWFVGRLSQLSIHPKDSLEKVKADLFALREPTLSPDDLVSFKNGPPVKELELSKKYSDAIATSKFYPTQPLYDYTLITVPDGFSFKNTYDCSAFGDILYSNQLFKLLSGSIKNLPDVRFITFPSRSGVQFNGIRDSFWTGAKTAFIDITQPSSSTLTQEGMCAYRRVGGEMEYTQFWVPKNGMPMK